MEQTPIEAPPDSELIAVFSAPESRETRLSGAVSECVQQLRIAARTLDHLGHVDTAKACRDTANRAFAERWSS